VIVDNKIKIRINPNQFKYYTDKGYNVSFYNRDLIININDLSKGSGVKINVKCDICDNLYNITYNNYNNQIKKHNMYVCFSCKNHKSKITNLEKYGCEWSLQNQNIKDKGKKTLLETIGVDNISKLQSIKNDRKNYFNNDNFKVKSKITLIKKYGVDNASKSDLIKSKKVRTCLKNFGVENPSQSVDIFEKSQKSGKKIKFHEETKLYHRGTYELDFLNYCYKYNIKIEKGPKIKYIINGRIKYYHSDFYLPKYNIVCEIKSDYYFNKYIDINLIKKKYTLNSNYNFLFIINKNYDELNKIMNYEKI